MADDRIIKALLQYEVDRGSTAKVAASVDTIARNFMALERNVNSVSETSKELSAKLVALNRIKAVDNLVREFVLVGKSANNFDDALEEMVRGLKDVGAGSREIERATDNFRKLEKQIQQTDKASKGLTLRKAESLLQGGSRALSGLGAGEAAGALGAGADVLQLLNSAKEGLAGLVPPVTAVGTASVTASTGVAAMSAALVPLLPILVPLGAALAVFAVSVKVISDEIAKGRTAVQGALEGLDAYYNAIREGTITSISASIVELKEQKRIEDEKLGVVKRSAALARVAVFNQFGKEGLLAAQVLGAFSDLDAAVAKGAKKSESLANQIGGLERAMGSTEVKSRSLANVLMTELGKALIAAFNTAKGYAEAEKNFQDLRGKLADKQAADIIKENEDKAATDKAFANQQNQERAAASRKYNDAVARAEEQAATDQLNIQANYATKVADILQTALDAADTALARLQDRERELLTGASREDDKDARKQALEDVEIQVKARRTERDDLVSHLRKVREIQNASKSEERDALLDRNFLALFQLQENKKDQQTEEQQAYEDQKADRQQALADEAVDLTRQRNFERNERRIALQQQLSDARDGYVREIALARQKRDAALALAVNQRDAEIALASQKRTAVLSVLLDQYKNEIMLASQSAEARKMILWAELAQTKQMLASMGIYQPGPPTTMGPGSANPATLSTNTNKLRAFADGGNAVAGHPFLFNDKFPGQRESMNGVMLPQGMGVAIPYQSGRVDPGSGGGVMLSQTFQIDGSGNPEVTARTIARISRQELVKFLNESIG